MDRIDELRQEAKELSKLTGIRFNLDHVIPLRGEKVCGLNIPENLEIMPAQLNSRKGNKYDEHSTMHLAREGTLQAHPRDVGGIGEGVAEPDEIDWREYISPTTRP